MTDLRHLTKEERDQILSVIKREDETREDDQKVFDEMKLAIKHLQVHPARPGVRKDILCDRCNKTFKVNKKSFCPRCHQKMCKNCKVELMKGGKWICNLCVKQRQLEEMTGAWVLKYQKRKHVSDTESELSEGELQMSPVAKRLYDGIHSVSPSEEIRQLLMRYSARLKKQPKLEEAKPPPATLSAIVKGKDKNSLDETDKVRSKHNRDKANETGDKDVPHESKFQRNKPQELEEKENMNLLQVPHESKSRKQKKDKIKLKDSKTSEVDALRYEKHKTEVSSKYIEVEALVHQDLKTTFQNNEKTSESLGASDYHETLKSKDNFIDDNIRTYKVKEENKAKLKRKYNSIRNNKTEQKDDTQRNSLDGNQEKSLDSIVVFQGKLLDSKDLKRKYAKARRNSRRKSRETSSKSDLSSDDEKEHIKQQSENHNTEVIKRETLATISLENHENVAVFSEVNDNNKEPNDKHDDINTEDPSQEQENEFPLRDINDKDKKTSLGSLVARRSKQSLKASSSYDETTKDRWLGYMGGTSSEDDLLDSTEKILQIKTDKETKHLDVQLHKNTENVISTDKTLHEVRTRLQNDDIHYNFSSKINDQVYYKISGYTDFKEESGDLNLTEQEQVMFEPLDSSEMAYRQLRSSMDSLVDRKLSSSYSSNQSNSTDDIDVTNVLQNEKQKDNEMLSLNSQRDTDDQSEDDSSNHVYGINNYSDNENVINPLESVHLLTASAAEDGIIVDNEIITSDNESKQSVTEKNLKIIDTSKHEERDKLTSDLTVSLLVDKINDSEEKFQMPARNEMSQVGGETNVDITYNPSTKEVKENTEFQKEEKHNVLDQSYLSEDILKQDSDSEKTSDVKEKEGITKKESNIYNSKNQASYIIQIKENIDTQNAIKQPSKESRIKVDDNTSVKFSPMPVQRTSKNIYMSDSNDSESFESSCEESYWSFGAKRNLLKENSENTKNVTFEKDEMSVSNSENQDHIKSSVITNERKNSNEVENKLVKDLNKVVNKTHVIEKSNKEDTQTDMKANIDQKQDRDETTVDEEKSKISNNKDTMSSNVETISLPIKEMPREIKSDRSTTEKRSQGTHIVKHKEPEKPLPKILQPGYKFDLDPDWYPDSSSGHENSDSYKYYPQFPGQRNYDVHINYDKDSHTLKVERKDQTDTEFHAVSLGQSYAETYKTPYAKNRSIRSLSRENKLTHAHEEPETRSHTESTGERGQLKDQSEVYSKHKDHKESSQSHQDRIDETLHKTMEKQAVQEEINNESDNVDYNPSQELHQTITIEEIPPDKIIEAQSDIDGDNGTSYNPEQMDKDRSVEVSPEHHSTDKQDNIDNAQKSNNDYIQPEQNEVKESLDQSVKDLDQDKIQVQDSSENVQSKIPETTNTDIKVKSISETILMNNPKETALNSGCINENTDSVDTTSADNYVGITSPGVQPEIIIQGKVDQEEIRNNIPHTQEGITETDIDDAVVIELNDTNKIEENSKSVNPKFKNIQMAFMAPRKWFKSVVNKRKSLSSVPENQNESVDQENTTEALQNQTQHETMVKENGVIKYVYKDNLQRVEVMKPDSTSTDGTPGVIDSSNETQNKNMKSEKEPVLNGHLNQDEDRVSLDRTDKDSGHHVVGEYNVVAEVYTIDDFTQSTKLRHGVITESELNNNQKEVSETLSDSDYIQDSLARGSLEMTIETEEDIKPCPIHENGRNIEPETVEDYDIIRTPVLHHKEFGTPQVGGSKFRKHPKYSGLEGSNSSFEDIDDDDENIDGPVMNGSLGSVDSKKSSKNSTPVKKQSDYYDDNEEDYGYSFTSSMDLSIHQSYIESYYGD